MLDTVETPAGEPASVFRSGLPLEEKLDRARTELLDLSARNRLLNIPRSAKSARTLEVIDEKSDEIFRLLVGASRPFTFLAGRAASGAGQEEDGEEIADLAQPEDDATDERGVFNRHADTRLQTRLTPAGLQKRLLDLYADARTLEEEQGVNILFLALGTLKWIDPKNAQNVRYAPLVLVPVGLERGNAAEKFKLRWRQDDPAPNLSLEAYLDREHAIRLPTFQADETFQPSAYAAAVAEAVAAKPGWSVQPDDVVLGFFSFAKFLMYRDLDPSVWPAREKISDRPLIRSLLSEGFDEPDDLIAEDGSIDAAISPSEMLHIVDSDSSQTLAVHEVRRDRNLVIQGPPGTGKSQTIANIIASAVADGKTVLFVAEKMAALDVVKRRLDATGVGDACLELHSNKANKRAVLDELRRTWELGSPKGDAPDALVARLTEARDKLNAHVARMHHPHETARLSPFQVVGQLARLRQAGRKPADIATPAAARWSPEDYRRRHALLNELVQRIEDIGPPAAHPWCGVGLDSVTPMEADRLTARLPDLHDRLSALETRGGHVATTLDLRAPARPADFDGLKALASRVTEAPNLTPAALAADAWTASADAVDELLKAGRLHAARAEALHDGVAPEGWSLDATAVAQALAVLPDGFGVEAFAVFATLLCSLPELQAEVAELATGLGLGKPMTARAVQRLVSIGERVASAPDASPEAFAADLWTDGVERAGDLADAVLRLEDARAAIGGRLSDAAWSLDLAAARATLAAHGGGFLRFLDGDWRKADKLVRSVLSAPKTPLADVLPLLDALGRGQAAIREVQAADEFGRQAFGGHWRGERSAFVPLQALAEWMRSLRGLGAEPRLIASRRPDQDVLRALAGRVSARLGPVRASLLALWDALGPQAPTVLTGAADAESADLEDALAQIAVLHEADLACQRVLAPVPAELPERRRILVLLAEGRAALARIEAGDALGSQAFDSDWRGSASDWAGLSDAADWIVANADIRMLASRIADRRTLAVDADALVADRDDFLSRLSTLSSDLRLDHRAFGLGDIETRPMAVLADRLQRWIDSPEALSKWVGYRQRALEGRRLDLATFIDRLESGSLPPADAVALFEMSTFEALFADQVCCDPELGRFDGELHGRLVSDFANLDRERIASARLEVVRVHHRKIPPINGGAVGPLGVLRGEIARRRGHMPIRQLMERAAPAVQALKPVLMMSPLSVAQYLPPGALHFDLLVMDEASQIQPVDALGAVARCKQVVVVGDPQQLPPTAFFAKMTGATDDGDEEEGAKVADIESILGLFTARGLPKRMLRWHYRSLHQSLIAVSNSQFYESKLLIVPSPYAHEPGMGLCFHHVADGLFDTGKTRTNVVEAKAVARAIIDHAMNSPELSLGVAAFSAQQRRAIQDQLELLRRDLRPEHETFFQSHPTEPFFVKNLENVQGDERDVIFISVGYAASAPGAKVPMRFGPLGMSGGDRRLNVLISRAKRRCEVFSSITDEDIDPDFAQSRPGVFAFRLFLHFARTGNLTPAETTGRDHEGVFEAQVAEALQAKGYQVHRNVGIAGLFIDLVIADADQPGRYLLGVECDGESYRDARSARDRDRIRRSVLEDHGWIIYRLWSVDWFQRPKEQLAQLVAAIEAAKTELQARGEAKAARSRAEPVDFVSIEREDVTEIGLVGVEEAAAGFVSPYQQAKLVRPAHCTGDIHTTPVGVLTALAEQAVAIEGPVHIDEVVARIRDAWGAGRAGGRIRDAVERGVAVSVRQGRLMRAEGFLWEPGTSASVRDRGQAALSLKRPEMLPPSEMRVAILRVVRANFGATPDQVVQTVSRDLGFRATSTQLRAVIDAAVGRALEAQEIVLQDAMLVLGPAADRAAPPKPAAAALEALIRQGESETLEFKQTLRWDVERHEINRKLEDVAVKTVAGFANQNGGVLLIGVKDDGQVTGLNPDFACLGGDRDKFELHLTNLIVSQFGHAFRASRITVSFPTVRDRTICRIDVQRSPTQIIVKLGDRNGQPTERFFVRSGNSTQELTLSQITAYAAGRF